MKRAKLNIFMSGELKNETKCCQLFKIIIKHVHIYVPNNEENIFTFN